MRSKDRIVRRLADESGIALVMALGIMFVLSVALTSIIQFTSSNERAAGRQNADQQAFALAEAGLNNALAVLHGTYEQGNVSYRAPGDLLPPRTSTYDGKTVTWSGTYCTGAVAGPCGAHDQYVWKLSSTGSVKNPTGPGAADITRTVSARVKVTLEKKKIAPEIWNWVYSAAGPSPGNGASSCDMTLSNQVTVRSPLYSVGNLCLEGQAKILQPATPTITDCAGENQTGCNRLVVGGWLWQRNNNNAVGTAPSRLTEAHIQDGCSTSTSSTATITRPCGWEANRVHVLTTGRYTDIGAARIDPPSFAWDDYYNLASPGPHAPCQTSSGTPPTFDTPERMRNNSVPGIFNLTPAAPYTCKTVDGELSWDPATRTLTIDGIVYIDGSAHVDTTGVSTGWGSNTAVRYVGQGFLWLSGTFQVKNAILCATPFANWSGCDFAAWDPNTIAMGVAADGSGGQNPTGVGIEVKGGVFQGLLYSSNDINVSTTGRMQGPMISLTKVSVAQNGDLSYPRVSILPAGAPGELPPPKLEPVDQFGG